MERLKGKEKSLIEFWGDYLHSSMERLKVNRARGVHQVDLNLHSSMERLKGPTSIPSMRFNSIYIPVWRD